MVVSALFTCGSAGGEANGGNKFVKSIMSLSGWSPSILSILVLSPLPSGTGVEESSLLLFAAPSSLTVPVSSWSSLTSTDPPYISIISDPKRSAANKSFSDTFVGSDVTVASICSQSATVIFVFVT